MKKWVLFFCLCSILWAKEDLSILPNWMAYTDSENALYHSLSEKAFAFLQQRQQHVDSLQSTEDWQNYQRLVRAKLAATFGEFPAKTDLSPQITGTIKSQDFTIQKLIFQSQPQFYVTAACVVPNNLRRKAPAVIYCAGHTELGWRSPTYQKIIFNLAKKGFIVLAFDPIGQGERLQYYAPDSSTSRVGSTTLEHSYVAAQCFLTGSSVAKIMVWDGIRAVDYLLSRSDVDSARIGITGRSGGGTQTTYIAAMDDRIYAAAPEAFITRWQRLLESIGPQDGEQNLTHFLANGLDFPDFLIARAPKPTLQISTTRDFFSIQGSMETYAEVHKVYQQYNAAEDYSLVYDDSTHASTLKNREALFAFFQRTLNNPGDPQEIQVPIYRYEELLSTKTGQVSTSFECKTVYQLNRELLSATLDTLRSQRENAQFFTDIANKAAEISGYTHGNIQQTVFCGQYKRSDYFVEKYFIEKNDAFPVPFLVFRPADTSTPHPIIFYLHPRGKLAYTQPGDVIEKWVRKGYIVVTADLINTGERGPGSFRGDSRKFKLGWENYNIWFLAQQVHSSLVGEQASEMSLILDYLCSRADVNSQKIIGIAENDMCATLQHCAVLDGRFTGMALYQPLLSYASLAASEYYHPQWIHTAVVNALTAYDLPDLLAAFFPRPLLIVHPLDHMKRTLTEGLKNHGYRLAEEQYTKMQLEANFLFYLTEPEDGFLKVVGNWLD